MNGQFFGRAEPITRGLPRGGLLSPVPWVLTFSKFSREVDRELVAGPFFLGYDAEWHFYINADDVAILIAHSDAGIMVQATQIYKAKVDAALSDMGSSLGMEKRNNMLISPEAAVGGNYRRSNGLSATMNKELPTRDARLTELLGMYQVEQVPRGVIPNSKKLQPAYVYADSLEVLWVQFDSLLNFQQHYKQVIRAARARQGVVATLARRDWGIDVGILRGTHATSHTSLTTYASVATGGTAYESCLKRLETQRTNIAARRVTAVSRSVRAAVLHFAADVISAGNLFIQPSRLAIYRALRTHNSTVQVDATHWLSKLYRMENRAISWKHLSSGGYFISRNGTRTSGELGVIPIGESWQVKVRGKEPEFGGGRKYIVPSMYYAEADLIMMRPGLKKSTYTLNNTHSVRDIGLQVL